MQKQEYLEEILYNLAKKTNGAAPGLFKYFGLAEDQFDCVLPLTRLQKNMYIDSLITGEPNNHNVGLALEIKQPLDVGIWVDAVKTVIREQPVLRTVLVKQDLVTWQAVKKHFEPEIPYTDLRGTNISRQEVYDLIDTKVRGPIYDFFSGPFWRTEIIQLADDQFFIVFGTHQVGHDAGSARSFFQRINQAYRKITGKEQTWSDTGSFAEYIFYNNDEFNKPDAIAFWKEKLQNAGSIRFPVSGVNREEAQVNKKIVTTKEHFLAIKAYCRSRAITPSLYFKSLLAILVQYYSRPGTDFVLFENIHGRTKDNPTTMGLYFYPILIKVPLTLFEEQKVFDDLPAYFKSYRKETLPYLEVSVEAFNEIIDLQEINVIYNYINFSIPSDLPVQSFFYQIEDRGNKNEVTLMIDEQADAFKVQLCYNTTVFTDDCFLERIIHLSNQIVGTEKILVHELEFITPAEKELIKGFNRSDESIPVHLSFNELFEKQVELYPGHTAVSYEESRLTYQELNNMANRLAWHLTENCGVKKGDFVGVWMERSHYTLVSMLAIMKSGAAYLPLDIALPAERIEYMLHDASPAALIINSDMIRKVPGHQKNVFVIDLQIKKLTTPASNLDLDINGTDLSYIIYTSGTTGKPKGVLVKHAGMINHLFQKLQDLSIEEQSVIVQNASAGFDISIWQFLAALLAGGKTLVYGDDIVNDVTEFVLSTGEDEVSIVEVVPSYFAMMMEIANEELKALPGTLKHVLVTGEVLKPNLVNAWYKISPEVSLVNAYGPAEASDDITHCMIRNDRQYDNIPLGKPLANAHIYIVDHHLHWCPPGIKGEIWVSGVCVGKGYLNDSERTAASFIKDPFNKDSEHLLYKTGDIGSWTSEGEILFHGRIDDQLKIRGNRIEPAEIENRLLESGNISAAVVMDKVNEEGNPYLIAFLKRNGDINKQELRKTLAKTLPAYMIPSVFAEVEEWPLTVNGKIDKQALLCLEVVNEDQQFIQAGTEVQKKLASIWSETLGRDNIGMWSDFFDLGGHSLKAMQMAARIHEVFDRKIELKQIFNNPTIAELAEVIESGGWMEKDKMNEGSSEMII